MKLRLMPAPRALPLLRVLAAVGLATAAVGTAFARVTPGPRSTGGSLFEGRALFEAMPFAEWRRVGGTATFELAPPAAGEGGPTLVGKGPIERNGFLVSPRQLADFRLAVDVRIGSSDNPRGEKMNSGIQIRSAIVDGTIAGLQVEVDPSERAWSGGVYHERGRGWLASLADNEAARKAFRPGEWNRYEIECIGPRVRTRINGVDCAQWLDAVSEGVLAFQVHGGPACEVAFRAPMLEELGSHAWRASVPGPEAASSAAPVTVHSVPAECRGFRLRLAEGARLRVLDEAGRDAGFATVEVPKGTPARTGSGDGSGVGGSAVPPRMPALRMVELLWSDGAGAVLVDGIRTTGCTVGTQPARIELVDLAEARGAEMLVQVPTPAPEVRPDPAASR